MQTKIVNPGLNLKFLDGVKKKNWNVIIKVSKICTKKQWLGSSPNLNYTITNGSYYPHAILDRKGELRMVVCTCTLSLKLYFSNKKDNGLLFAKLNSPSGVFLKSSFVTLSPSVDRIVFVSLLSLSLVYSSPYLSLSLFLSFFPSLVLCGSETLILSLPPSAISLCGLV
jgi:hypothetical protein